MRPDPSSIPTVLLVTGAGQREAQFWNSFADFCSAHGVASFAVFQGSWENASVHLSFPHITTGHGDREVREFLGGASSAEIEKTVRFLAGLVLAQVRPAAALVWNGFDEGQRTWRRVLESAGVPTLVAERGAFPGLFCVEAIGLNGQSEFQRAERKLAIRQSELSSEMRRAVARLLEAVKAARRVSYPSQSESPAPDLRARLGLGRDEKLILFLGNWDEQSGVTGAGEEVHRAQSPLYDDSHAAASAIAAAVQGMSGHHVLLRPHPFDRRDWSALADGRHVHLLGGAEVVDLIAQADAVAGLTTNLLFQAIAHDRPLILMGRPAFHGFGFSYDHDRREDLRDVIRDAVSRQGWEERLLQRDRFLVDYLFRYCFSAEAAFLELGVQDAGALLTRLDLRECDPGESPAAPEPLQALGVAIGNSNRRALELRLYIEELERRSGSLSMFLRANAGRLLRVLSRTPGSGRLLDSARRRREERRTR